MPDPVANPKWTAIIAPVFRASELKIRRARKHVAEADAEISAYLEANPARFEIRIPDRPAWIPPNFAIFLVDFHVPGVHEEIGPIIGDVIHNLRSSLDIMACELVRLNGRSEREVYFPFCKCAEGLDAMIKSKNFHRAGNAAVELVRSLAPHRGGNIALRALHDLANRDKHQTLIPTARNAATPILDTEDGCGNRIWPPKIIGDPNLASETKVVFPNDSPFAGEEVVPVLHRLVDLTTGIIEQFAMLVCHPGPSEG